MKNNATYNPRREFTKDIEWSLRYLSIYNLSKRKALEIVDVIVTELCTPYLQKLSSNIRHEMFVFKLGQAVAQLKN